MEILKEYFSVVNSNLNASLPAASFGNATLDQLDELNINGSPDYGVQGLWIVGWLCLLEYVLLWFQDKPLPPPHENLLSMAHAIFNYLVKVCVRSSELSVYIWLWRRYALAPGWFSDSLLSFAATIVLFDFGYYWLHRFSHEVMMFWAIHQVHHSSADFTVSVGLRHSPLQNLFSWIFYLPLAFIGLPPSHLVVHLQLNLFYQTWLHTSAVEKLGPLEMIFNTPSHHRVHHGATKYCLDVNYGGVFIFWDFLFGTFEKERLDEPLVYGILRQPTFWNIISHQVFYLGAMVEKAKSMSNWTDFANTFWKGPSWIPGSTRTGRELDVPYFGESRERVPANTSWLVDSYVFAHLLSAVFVLSAVMGTENIGVFSFTVYALFIVCALSTVGLIYEGRPVASTVERCRTLAGMALALALPLNVSLMHQFFLVFFYFASLLAWCSDPPLLNQTQSKQGTQTDDGTLKQE